MPLSSFLQYPPQTKEKNLCLYTAFFFGGGGGRGGEGEEGREDREKKAVLFEITTRDVLWALNERFAMSWLNFHNVVVANCGERGIFTRSICIQI